MFRNTETQHFFHSYRLMFILTRVFKLIADNSICFHYLYLYYMSCKEKGDFNVKSVNFVRMLQTVNWIA